MNNSLFNIGIAMCIIAGIGLVASAIIRLNPDEPKLTNSVPDVEAYNIDNTLTTQKYNVNLIARKTGVVIFRNYGGTCSAVHLGNGLFLTASHCINIRRAGDATGNAVAINNISGFQELYFYAPFVSDKDGLALLRIDWAKRLKLPAVKIADKPSNIGVVRCFPVDYSVQVPKAGPLPVRYFEALFTRTFYENNIIYAQVHARGGCSGGGMFNVKNELMGITSLRITDMKLGGFLDVTKFKKDIEGAVRVAQMPNAKSIDWEAARELFFQESVKKIPVPDLIEN